MTIFKVLVQEPDREWEFIDGSVIRAHQHSSGAFSIHGYKVRQIKAKLGIDVSHGLLLYGLPL